ncbi:Protein of unknown function [Tessaracoccus bendigoensis DSM 12906]|uniref:DUF4245 domain-containing protein n=2 Tax=Tessaracoccus TaxID=72763 RepID=A0A1M6LPE4_9ACTN|nr:Protein of unknown function [Tessaracoccus bendigoensis DSM 12906]
MTGMAAHNRKSTARDMFISMAVIMVPVLLIVWFFTQTTDHDPEAADIAGVLTRARAESPYPLLVAQGLGDDWTPVRVAFAKDGQPWITKDPAVGDSWQVGYLSPDGTYFGVQQRNDGGARFIASVTRDGAPVGGEVDAAGRSWERFESSDGRTRSLVSETDNVTSIVTADTDFLELEAFAATLAQVELDQG